MRKVLLIGNGPSATKFEFGDDIDNFDGKIVRFNAYHIEGYEKYVGTRTDIWVTCDMHRSYRFDYEKVYIVSYARKRDPRLLNDLRQRYPDCEHFPEWSWDFATKLANFQALSSGAIAAGFFQKDYQVYIYGFDFFSADKHHYGDDLEYCYHNKDREKYYFGKLLRLGKVIPFNDYLRKLNYKVFNAGLDCEKDKYDWIYSGGCQGYGTRNHGRNTYDLIKALEPESLLDVGCGKGQYVEWCIKQGIKAVGVDFSSGYGIQADVRDLPFSDKQFCITTAFDLLEHLKEEDLDKAISELKRVTRRCIIASIGYGLSRIKTPDGSVDLHPINDKDEQWWLEKIGHYGKTYFYGEDYYKHPFIICEVNHGN